MRGGSAENDRIDVAELQWAADVPIANAHAYALSTRILLVARLVHQSFEDESRRVGLNIGESLVLDALRRQGPPYETTAARLKEQFFISFAGIGKRLARLEELGFIERERDERDRRSQRIRLTRSGLETLQPAKDGELTVHTEAMLRLGDEKVQALSRLLRELQREIEKAA